MKLVFDFFPVIFFFVAYKFFGIFTATAVAMGASALQLGLAWYKNRRVEYTYVITFVLIFVLGGATLLFHNDMFIKWKPTAIYWSFALFFFLSQFFGKEPVIQKLLGNKLVLPHNIWKLLNASWITFFVVIGGLNLFVIYHFSTNAWVNFKLFGVVGMTILFGIFQSLYISKYLDKK